MRVNVDWRFRLLRRKKMVNLAKKLHFVASFGFKGDRWRKRTTETTPQHGNTQIMNFY